MIKNVMHGYVMVEFKLVECTLIIIINYKLLDIIVG
jgi:hypothetical protein